MRAEVAMKVTGFFATVLILGTWSAAARASTDNWNGDGGDNKWSDAENWQGGTAPVNGAALVFSGTMRLTPVNDIADLSLSMITFDGTAGSFTLSGNAINSLTFITSNSSQTQTLSLPITATTGVTVTASAGAVDLIGALSGGGLTKTGTGTLVLAATNTYTGPTTISQGNLLVSGALGNTAVSVNGSGGLGGTGSISGQVTLAGGSTSTAQGTLDLVDGAIGTLTFSDTNSADTVLTVGGAAVANPSILNFEVGSAADLLVLSAGKLVVNPGGGLINITPLDGFGPGTYDLIDFLTGQASGLNSLRLNTPTIDGYPAYLQPTATAEELVVVPEPGTLALLMVAVCGAAVYQGVRSRRKKQ
jgi:autotransporter-associated beta strand protein